MPNSRDEFSRNLSILYRLTLKHFDNLFVDEEIGFAQLLFLTQIYENEGISMNELVHTGSYDKGTVTKSLQKLESSGYVEVKVSETDKRSKRIYTTTRCREIITPLFLERQKWLAKLSAHLSSEEKESFLKGLSAFAKQAQEAVMIEHGEEELQFYGLQKISLVDYPGKVVSTLLITGSNFRSPYATTRDYLFLNEADSALSEEDVFTYLLSRKTILDGICIRGGEPLLYAGLLPFLRRIKQYGLAVKIETNGTNFQRLQELVEEGLVDYISLEILNTQAKYFLSAGVEDFDFKSILKSMDYLIASEIDYDFSTTVVEGYHDVNDIKKIARRIVGAKKYYLVEYDETAASVRPDLKAVSLEKMEAMKEACRLYVPHTELRLLREK